MRAPSRYRNETEAQCFSPDLEQGQFLIESLESTFSLKPFIEESAVENCKPFISCGF